MHSEHGACHLHLHVAATRRGNHIFVGWTIGWRDAADWTDHIVRHTSITDWGDKVRLVRHWMVTLQFTRVAPVTWARLATAGAWEHLMWLQGEGDQAVCKVCDAGRQFVAALLERGHSEREHRGCRNATYFGTLTLN